VSPTAPTAETRLRANGLAIPDGHSIVSLAERPDLIEPAADHNVTAWPDFMLEDPIANANFSRAWKDWPQFQFVLLDARDEIVATNNAMPLAWDGTDDDLPAGWDAQVLRSVEAIAGKAVPNTLGALQIVVARGTRGSGLSGTMLSAMRAAAKAARYGAVIACVRPTLKSSYPLTPIESYATWTRSDGLPVDPWIRLHVRLGGRIVRAAPESMTMRGTVAEWESWTGLTFPESGRYAVPFATQPIDIDRDRDEGVYHDQNVWVVHDLT
jgi:hypothetical protein